MNDIIYTVYTGNPGLDLIIYKTGKCKIYTYFFKRFELGKGTYGFNYNTSKLLLEYIINESLSKYLIYKFNE